MTKNILKSDKLYRCKWFPKENQKYKDLHFIIMKSTYRRKLG